MLDSAHLRSYRIGHEKPLFPTWIGTDLMLLAKNAPNLLQPRPAPLTLDSPSFALMVID